MTTWEQQTITAWEQAHPRTREDFIQDLWMFGSAVLYVGAILFMVCQAMLHIGA